MQLRKASPLLPLLWAKCEVEHLRLFRKGLPRTPPLLDHTIWRGPDPPHLPPIKPCPPPPDHQPSNLWLAGANRAFFHSPTVTQATQPNGCAWEELLLTELFLVFHSFHLPYTPASLCIFLERSAPLYGVLVFWCCVPPTRFQPPPHYPHKVWVLRSVDSSSPPFIQI